MYPSASRHKCDAVPGELASKFSKSEKPWIDERIRLQIMCNSKIMCNDLKCFEDTNYCAKKKAKIKLVVIICVESSVSGK